MSKVDDELTRRLRGAERPVDNDGLFEGLARKRSHRERVRRVQAGLLAFAVLAATAGGFVFLREVFDVDPRDVGEQLALPANGEIVFSREGPDGRFHLFASQPDGSGVRQITDDATNDTDPAVSPGGETIAYVHELDREIPEEASEANADTPRLSVIATVPIDGGVVSWHTPDELFASDPAWSPDGTQIAFVGQRGTSSHLYVVGVDSLEPEPLTSPLDVQVADPTWSPDGTRIAFALRGPVGPWGLASIHPDGTGLEPLRTPNGDEEAPAWSPDGSRIALLRSGNGGREIWTVDPEGGSPLLIARVKAFEADLVWAPDGTALLVSDGEWIYRVDPTPQGDAGANFDQLVRGVSPSWQPLHVAAEPSVTTSPEPRSSPEPELDGRDIGFGFPVCQVSEIEAQLDGEGAADTAVVATRLDVDGRCPSVVDEAQAYVGVDLDDDGFVDTVYGPISCEAYYCRVFAAPDLNGDGDTHELLVVESAGSVVGLGVYALEAIGSPASDTTAIVRIEIGEPDYRERGFVTGEPARLFIGGDEGWSYRVRCEDHGVNRFLYVSRAYHAIDESGPWTVDETTLFYADLRLNVFDAREPELSTSDDPLGPQPEDLCGAPIPQV